MAASLPNSALLTLAIGMVGSQQSTAWADGHGTAAEAVARAHPAGGDAVYLKSRSSNHDGPARSLARATRRSVERRGGDRNTILWRASSHERIVTDLSWSRQHDALAFATRDRRGTMTLVVVLVGGPPDGHVMTWPIPAPANPSSTASSPTVTWLGRDRVGFGRSEVRPDVVASWRVRQ